MKRIGPKCDDKETTNVGNASEILSQVMLLNPFDPF